MMRWALVPHFAKNDARVPNAILTTSQALVALKPFLFVEKREHGTSI